ncbi:hypothetical protein [Hymenobacter cellulosivorans]|uniref:Uncharacterized protein n=1 Tax=Hymenobacter cellulosivorans TaxID=2932249 RepID=A0ABY4F8D6_9BACT|nr:hypothetical protein [Hymenobacter cellulosivorans]UOQ52914.1 hypothetical protein MUN80_24630 [Hymenobacter cellulosivorans]
MLPATGSAQQTPAWPRHPTTGRVEFTGVLPWPTPRPTLPQQQALVKRWYLAKLTAGNSGRLGKPDTLAATFAGQPTIAYLGSLTYTPDHTGVVDSVYDLLIWSVWYTVRLTPTAAGLTYHLSEFEFAETVYDAASSDSLEKMLPQYSGQLAVFHRRLRKALAGW